MNKRTRILLVGVAMATTMLAGGCSKTPVTNVSDIDVTEHVKTALQKNDALKSFDIKVVTQKGDVRLTGMVDSQVQIDEAIKIARASEGAHTVHDELVIRK